MNPYRIYRDEAARALRLQATASEYSCFVAMPFREGVRYRSSRILEKILAAAEEANGQERLPRKFSPPQRVDQPQGAVVITEEIVLQILRSHVFVADLTFQNPGVILETGIAMGMKPVKQIVLLTQQRTSKLHFNLKASHVIRYSQAGKTARIADSFVAAARHFENQVRRYLHEVTTRLSPEALIALRYFAECQQQSVHVSLHSSNRGPKFEGPEGLGRFDVAMAELRSRDLVWTHYLPHATPSGDAYGMHATEFGWAVIERMWPELPKPSGAKVDLSSAT